MRLRYLVYLTLLTTSACHGQRLPEPTPVVGKPLILLTANGRTSLTFFEDQDITIQLRTSSNTKSCWVLAPVKVDLPTTQGSLSFSPTDSLYPKLGKSVKIEVRCVSRQNESADATLLIEHK